MVYFVVGVVSCNMIINDELVNPTVLSCDQTVWLVCVVGVVSCSMIINDELVS